MTFRDRIRRAFKSSSSDSSSLGDSSSHKSEKNSKHATWPSNVYAPGEPMPRAKYRAPVKKEHKDKLDAFSWGTAWRRRSQVSEYSPMGSRMPSRRGSLLSRKSFGGKSAKRMSVDGKSTDGRNIGLDNAQTKGRNAARATQLSTEMEAEGDDDVTNVGLSRVQSRDKDKIPSRQLSADDTRRISTRDTVPNRIDGTLSDAPDHQPFTEEELALALKKSHLTVPKQS